MRIGAVSVISGLVALAACKAEPPAAPTPAVLTFTATDFAFTGPTASTPGLTTFRLVNQGQEPHHIIVARVDSGKTLQDMMAFYAEQDQEDPAWATYVGGVTAVMPGDSAEASSVLAPGTYAVLCFIPSPDGTMHLRKGMGGQFTIAGEAGKAPEPTADIEVRLVDHDFRFSQPLKAGVQTLKVVNDGAQVHEIQLVRMDQGKTMADLMAAFAPGAPPGPPPGRMIGGMGALSTGQTGYVTFDLEPGTYVLLCFVPDVADGAPHMVKGMAQEITIS